MAVETHKVSSLGFKGCLELAERLYDQQFTPDDPATLPIREDTSIHDLQRECESAGIRLELGLTESRENWVRVFTRSLLQRHRLSQCIRTCR